MTEFTGKLPVWNAEGTEPPISKVEDGWKVDERPPADYMNYLQNTTYEAIRELQDNAVHKFDVGDLSELQTTAKNNLVEAVNEVKRSGITQQQVQDIADAKTDASLANQKVEVAIEQIDFLSQKDIKRVILPSDKLYKVKRKIPFPEKFTWKDAPIVIHKDAMGRIITDFDAATFKPDVTGKKIYYVSTTGKDTNDGLTPQTSLRNIFTARLKDDVGIIEIADGFYEDQTGFNNSPGVINAKDIIIRAAQGASVTIAAGRISLSWTKTAEKTNVYQTNRTLVTGVYDLKLVDANGDHKKLALKSSIDEVDANQGSYYTDGTILYVHTGDSRVADNQTLVLMDVYNFRSVGNYRVYFENIKFYGGKEGCISSNSVLSTDIPIVSAKKCEFKYSTGGNGGTHLQGVTAYLQNCIAAWNKSDGFNYHDGTNVGGNVPAKAIEVNCVGRSNGIGRGTNTDNGSTIHDGGKIIRVNCTYFGNEGPNMHDVNAGSEAWVVGCESYDSKATTSSRRTNYRVEDYAKMWLDSCIGFDSDLSLYGSTTCEIRLRNSVFDKDDSVLGLLEYY